VSHGGIKQNKVLTAMSRDSDVEKNRIESERIEGIITTEQLRLSVKAVALVTEPMRMQETGGGRCLLRLGSKVLPTCSWP